MADESKSGKNLSLRDKRRAAGRLSGLATARKSEEFLIARATKGGLTTRMIHGSAFYGTPASFDGRAAGRRLLVE